MHHDDDDDDDLDDDDDDDGGDDDDDDVTVVLPINVGIYDCLCLMKLPFGGYSVTIFLRNPRVNVKKFQPQKWDWNGSGHSVNPIM